MIKFHRGSKKTEQVLRCTHTHDIWQQLLHSHINPFSSKNTGLNALQGVICSISFPHGSSVTVCTASCSELRAPLHHAAVNHPVAPPPPPPSGTGRPAPRRWVPAWLPPCLPQGRCCSPGSPAWLEGGGSAAWPSPLHCHLATKIS